MRPAFLTVALAVLGPTGCSAFVAASGTDLAKLQTRDEVRQKFGEPVAVGTADGVAYEEFSTRRKISDNSKGIYICMYDVATLGLTEVYLLPYVLCEAGRRSLLGQTIRAEYNAAGEVVGVRYNGGYLPGCLPQRLTFKPPASQPGAVVGGPSAGNP